MERSARQRELFDRFTQMLHAGYTESGREQSDRTFVLLGGAVLDQCITATLQNFLAECDESKKLFDPGASGPLSTFAAKVNLCVALGLLPASEAKWCRDIAKIRNTFAHEIEASFTDKHVAALERAEVGLFGETKFSTLTLGGRYQSACGAMAMWIVLRWSEDQLSQQRVVLPDRDPGFPLRR